MADRGRRLDHTWVGKKKWTHCGCPFLLLVSCNVTEPTDLSHSATRPSGKEKPL
jgi:hypothetical protein